MAQFDYKKFLKEGGIEKYLLEAQFGNDIDSRYEYIRPLMSRLPDSARTEAMIDGMEEARAEDDKAAFDFYFVETMKMLGLEQELMEPDDVISEPDYEDYAPDSALGPNPSFVEEGESLINPEAEEIDAEDLEASADYFDSLAENDKVLDEFLQMPAQEEEEGAEIEVLDDVEELEIEKDITININLQEVEGEVQTENKLLKASNTLEDALNKVADDLTDEQIDKFTKMILDLRDKVKGLKENEEGQSFTPEQEKTYEQLKYVHGEVMNLLHRRMSIANRSGTELNKWRDQIEWGIKSSNFPDFWEDINLKDLLSNPDLKSETGKNLNHFFKMHAKDIKAEAERSANIFGTEKVGGKKLDATTQLLVKAYKTLARVAESYKKAWDPKRT